MAVKPTRPDDRGIDHRQVIGGADDDHPRRAVQAVQKGQQTVDDAGHVTRETRVPSPTVETVDLVNEQDRGGIRDRFFDGLGQDTQHVTLVAKALTI